MRVLILLALAASALALPRQSNNRIVGGEDTTIETYPYMVSLQYLWWGIIWSPSCGGTIMTSRSILTAAHCLIGSTANEWQTRVGSTRSSNGGQVMTSQSLIIHENYDTSTEANDLGVIILNNAIAFSDSAAIARIPVGGFVLPDGSNVVAIGWGYLQEGGPPSDILQHVTVNVINHALCKQRYDARKEEYERTTGRLYPFVVDEGMVCTGILDVGGKDGCQGDSGGPVSIRQPDVDIVYGISSWGDGCAHPVFPGVNVRVSHYTDWIIRNASV